MSILKDEAAIQKILQESQSVPGFNLSKFLEYVKTKDKLPKEYELAFFLYSGFATYFLCEKTDTETIKKMMLYSKDYNFYNSLVTIVITVCKIKPDILDDIIIFAKNTLEIDDTTLKTILNK